MPHALEYPGVEGFAVGTACTGHEATRSKPTGRSSPETSFKVEVHGLAETKTKSIMVLQHPCALRTNGVDLQPRLMVAEVRTHSLVPAEDWTQCHLAYVDHATLGWLTRAIVGGLLWRVPLSP